MGTVMMNETCTKTNIEFVEDWATNSTAIEAIQTLPRGSPLPANCQQIASVLRQVER